jgi:rhamnosyltransferase subunit B
LITHATTPVDRSQFFDASIEACQALGWQAIVVTPFRELLPRHLPDGVYYHPFVVPIQRLLPHLKAVVHHGGVGMMAHTMAAGIPQLILGLGYDRPDNGARAQRLGVAEYIPATHWQADMIAASLNRLTTSQGVAQQCRKIAEKLLSDTPLENACRYLEGAITASPTTANSSEIALPANNCPPPSASSDVLSNLSAEKRALLAMKLRQKKLAAGG